ncbi:lysophospholipid acyltransferase family protein [Vannielia litorea]|uniref:lysophospholipid acyltransferase family protein n=1 Tax=Vannielia litorea TaxID=1217970 RepID=UPI001C98B93E|nr:lysophospholipid acyltransferase family protein [Vannielia litorea]MBY6152920.1 lysophospholipid acyltransferase family protein [Vannielia litorea]
MHQVARDITYANSVRSKPGRAFVKLLENATGRIGLIKRADGYEDDVAGGADFWDVIRARYGLSLKVTRGSLENIPRTGPLVLVANHPYGILDGLMMGHILSQTRGDFRILAHQVFKRSEELNRIILPIDFDGTREAQAVNLATRKEALAYLAQGGAIGVFPGGTVSTSAKLMSRPLDPGWRRFTAKMIAKSGATVVPVCFEGANSRLFQLASHIHSTLRIALLIKEFRARIDEPVEVAVGQPVPRDEIAAHASDPKALMDFLREATYSLSNKPVRAREYGKEFEDFHKA